jgi:L-ascorbate metabolism protein UlaG (beta-lactamase superfamily)
MGLFAQKVRERKVGTGELAIYWLSQAGFVFKSSANKIVYVDVYFSEVVERAFGFKRMMTCPIAAEEVEADLIVCTHEHLDHMDTEALPVIAERTNTHFSGPVECVKQFRAMGIPESRCHLLEEGKKSVVAGITVHGVYADHGELAPDALGVVLDFEGIRVYHTGDTAFRPDEFGPVIKMQPDVLIPCINGRYGNMDATEAARLVSIVNPRTAIASHFWMFVEHDGDPAAFLAACSELAPGVQALVMKPGEELLFSKDGKGGIGNGEQRAAGREESSGDGVGNGHR